MAFPAAPVAAATVPPPAPAKKKGASSARTAILALIGLAQGGSIYAAQRWMEDARLMPEHGAALGFVCVGGLTAQLLLRERMAFSRWLAAMLWGIVWALPFFWVFHRAALFDFSGRSLSLALLSALGVFLAAPFLAGGFSYARLFARLTDNLLAAAAGLLVAGVSHLLIRLGAELFDILGIVHLREWTKSELFSWLAYPALFGAGMSVSVSRFRRAGLALFRLPAFFAALLALAFAAALGAAGPAPLWERDIAAPLLLAFTLALLFFTVAAFGEGAKKAEGAEGAAGAEDAEESEEAGNWTRGILSLALLTLPVFSALALWGLRLRVEQYGLTPPRSWGLLVGM